MLFYSWPFPFNCVSLLFLLFFSYSTTREEQLRGFQSSSSFSHLEKKQTNDIQSGKQNKHAASLRLIVYPPHHLCGTPNSKLSNTNLSALPEDSTCRRLLLYVLGDLGRHKSHRAARKKVILCSLRVDTVRLIPSGCSFRLDKYPRAEGYITPNSQTRLTNSPTPVHFSQRSLSLSLSLCLFAKTSLARAHQSSCLYTIPMALNERAMNLLLFLCYEVVYERQTLFFSQKRTKNYCSRFREFEGT